MVLFKKKPENSKVVKGLKLGLVSLAIGSTILFTGCGDNVEYVEEEEIQEFTQGVITTVDEVETDRFKIADETVVPKKEDSRIIANYLDGTADTLTLDEARLVDADDPQHRRRSSMSGVLMAGFIGYHMGRSPKVPPSASAYKNKSTFDKVKNTTGKSMASTAKKTTVKRPKTGKSGYGSGKSSRSSGG